MSALGVVAAVQLWTLGLVYVNACRWVGRDRRLLSVTWHHLWALDGRELLVFVARDGGRWCMSSVVGRKVYDSASYCQFSIVSGNLMELQGKRLTCTGDLGW